MPKDVNYPCMADASKGEVLFDWDENHIHEYRHYGTPWMIRIQRVKENAATAFVQFRDLFSNKEIPVPPNVRVRDDCAKKEVMQYPNSNYFRISPFTNFTVLIHNCIPALKIVKQSPPYFSIITLGPRVSFNFIRQSKPQEKMHWEKGGVSMAKTAEEEESRKKLELLNAEPHWDTLEETFPPKPPEPTIRSHPDHEPVFTFS